MDFEVADRAADGEITVVNVPWKFADGRIDWLFNATDERGPHNPEWTWQLNRMYFWNDFARAYEETGDPKYAEAFARQLESWLDQTGGIPPEEGFNDRGSPWRTIEEGLRLMGSWHNAWNAFRSSPAFTPALQERFRAAALAQASHLLRRHSIGGNWLLIEMNGAYAFASDFAEFPESPTIRRKAAALLSEGIRSQILPDGMQYELSPDYHSVAVGCAVQMYSKAVEGGFAGELPDDFASLIEKMGDAVLALTTPSFIQPRFNDCFTMHGDKMIGSLARFFPNRADFAWIVSGRSEGEPPAGESASRYLPWAGFAVMRSDWGPDATYLAFDVGPLGRAHIHQDKLSFNIWKGGEELVFEDGGGQYDDSHERIYALSGYGHNTLLVDGLAQQRSEPRVSSEPIDAGWETSSVRDRAVGVYDQGFGPDMLRLATQSREIVFDKVGDVFTVTDDIRSADGGDHDYTLLFQLDTVNTVLSSDARHLRACYGRNWDLEIAVVEGGIIETAVGRPYPDLAGWYIARNDKANHKATTVFVKAPRCRDCRFVIRFKPVKAERAQSSFDFLGYRCEVDLPEGSPAAVVVSLHGYGGSSASTPEEIRAAYLERGWAVCRPEAHPDSQGKPSWNVGYPPQTTMTEDDTAWLAALADKLRADFGVEKVFLTGMSNGGEMCYQMFYRAPKAFDAIASVAGLTMKILADGGAPQGGVPFMEIHGTDDKVSLYEGLSEPNYWGEYLAVPDAVRRVEEANGGYETRLVTIEGAGHQWTTPLFDIPKATADFFSRCFRDA